MQARTVIEQRHGDAGGRDGDLERLRAHLHEMWAGVAGAWGEHAAYNDARGAALSERMLELTAPRPGRARARAGLRAGGSRVRRPRAGRSRRARWWCPTSSPR